MLWLSTLSVFLPSLTSSSIVWARPSVGHMPSTLASNQTFFMSVLPLLDRHFSPKRLAMWNRNAAWPAARRRFFDGIMPRFHAPPKHADRPGIVRILVHGLHQEKGRLTGASPASYRTATCRTGL